MAENIVSYLKQNINAGKPILQVTSLSKAEKKLAIRKKVIMLASARAPMESQSTLNLQMDNWCTICG